jgi:pimeloyl-ACP methyl ester carboxylesterase
MPKARVNGIVLHYEEYGEGAPMLGIHGGGSTALLWEDAARRLGQLGRAIIYDRRGCTRSERPNPYERTTVAEHADDAAALTDSLGVGPAVVIGRSWGGAVAIDLALRHPGKARALVLLEGDALGVSPAAFAWTRALRDELRAVAARDGVGVVYEALVSAVMGAGTWDAFPEEVRRVLTDNGPALLAELGYVDDPHPDAAALATIDLPALVVSARDSLPEFREMAAATAMALPDARQVDVDGGHLIDPAAPEVLEFVEEIAAGR